jgi:hypothetical protein
VDDEGIAWPSRHTLACAPLARKVQHLEDKGLLDVQRRWRSSNAYRLKCQGFNRLVPVSHFSGASGGTKEPSEEPSGEPVSLKH